MAMTLMSTGVSARRLPLLTDGRRALGASTACGLGAEALRCERGDVRRRRCAVHQQFAQQQPRDGPPQNTCSAVQTRPMRARVLITSTAGLLLWHK